MSHNKHNIYIDSLALVSKNKSGVGLTLERTLYEMGNSQMISHKYNIYLIAPLGKAKYLKTYEQQNIHTKTIYLPARLMEILLRLRVFPPIDWIYGSGVYVFPNYRNWPVWRARSVTYVYDVSFINNPETVRPKNQRYLSKYIYRWISRTDKVITITKQLKWEIERYLHVPPQSIGVVYCGVDKAKFYKRPSAEIDRVKNKYKLPYKNYLLVVGNIEPRKNLTNALRAYKLLPKHIQNDYGLVFVGGDGWLNEEFYSTLNAMQAEDYNVLKIDKYVQDSDLPALYSGSAALLHTAIYEGFGIPPLEAMACETPVLVSDIPAIREVVGEAGHYFDPVDPNSISKTISKLLTADPELERIGLGKNRSSELSWENSAKELETIIDEQFSRGPQNKPVRKRAKLIYNLVDTKIRSLFGERTQNPYRPIEMNDKKSLRDEIYGDFLEEQPSRTQIFALKLYQGSKHVMATFLKRVYGVVRNRFSER